MWSATGKTDEEGFWHPSRTKMLDKLADAWIRAQAAQNMDANVLRSILDE